jgi:LytS/YehU family sensor histidine kinase
MGQRFADRVTVTWQVDDTLRTCRVPALILQPLLENAFRHGVERHAGAARIDITVERAAHDRLRASVTCSLGDLAAPRGAAGVGLDNVRRRLALLHGEHATLELVPLELAPLAPGVGRGGVRATITLPVDLSNEGRETHAPAHRR